MRRVAVTGIGLVSPLGHNATDIYEAARVGRSSIIAADEVDAINAQGT